MLPVPGKGLWGSVAVVAAGADRKWAGTFQTDCRILSHLAFKDLPHLWFINDEFEEVRSLIWSTESESLNIGLAAKFIVRTGTFESKMKQKLIGNIHTGACVSKKQTEGYLLGQFALLNIINLPLAAFSLFLT